jgi:hypothetical protein
VAARLTLVTLDCTPFDIATSVSEADAAVYSPAVLRLRGQSWESVAEAHALTDNVALPGGTIATCRDQQG